MHYVAYISYSKLLNTLNETNNFAETLLLSLWVDALKYATFWELGIQLGIQVGHSNRGKSAFLGYR